jgi:hypothetical protein
MRRALALIALLIACDKRFNYDYCKTHPGAYPQYCGLDASTQPDAPSTMRYTIFVATSGLVGSIVLQNNGGDDLTIAMDGTSHFATTLPSGAPYHVTVKTQPANETCNVSNATGTIQAGDVQNINVTCAQGGIHCDASVCTPMTQVCCDSGGTYSCVAASASCPTTIACDDDKDCGGGGMICCARVNSPGHLLSTQCELEPACLSGGKNVVLCDPNGNPCPADLGGGCVPTTVPELQPLGDSECLP